VSHCRLADVGDGFADKNIRKPEDIKGKTVPSRRVIDVTDLAAVSQENKLEGNGFQDRCRRRAKPSSTPS